MRYREAHEHQLLRRDNFDFFSYAVLPIPQAAKADF